VKRPTHSRGSGACGIRYMGTRLVKYLSGWFQPLNSSIYCFPGEYIGNLTVSCQTYLLSYFFSKDKCRSTTFTEAEIGK
jgi:hypothetical protein